MLAGNRTILEFWSIFTYYWGFVFDFRVTPEVLSTDCDRRNLITLIVGV